MDRKFAARLADQTFRWQTAITRELAEKRQVDGRKARVLADLRDYFTYACLRAVKEEAEQLVRLFAELESMVNSVKNRFHAGF